LEAKRQQQAQLHVSLTGARLRNYLTQPSIRA
jgi:hypothetical protein